ncbi:MAG: metal ABC transporter permease [Verrucomicrobia bacterium]|nr:metal ABC transporter permease [Verrucomicrobiota bacterium]
MDIVFSIMMWPLLACLLLPAMLVYLGLHIVRREIIFVDLALAQVAALGTCFCIVFGTHTHTWEIPLGFVTMDLSDSYLWSLGFTLVGAAIFTLTRDVGQGRVPQEAIIGIIYVVAAAAALLILSRSTEGNEELKRTLVGEVLLVGPGPVVKTFLMFVAVGIVHFVFRKRFLALSFDPKEAEAGHLSHRWWNFVFYALFGIVVTSFVQIGGVLLTFSYLIVPAVCANLLARSLGAMMAIGWIIATLAGMGGLFVSYKFDLPTGAAIVCVLGAALILVEIMARVRRPA